MSAHKIFLFVTNLIGLSFYRFEASIILGVTFQAFSIVYGFYMIELNEFSIYTIMDVFQLETFDVLSFLQEKIYEKIDSWFWVET